MKIIDLLVKMSNDENYKPTFEFKKNIYKYNEKTKYYEPSFMGLWKIYMILNDEVEIIEEDKKIEKIGYLDNADGSFWLENTLYNSEPIKILCKKLNELIDEINNLKENK